MRACVLVPTSWRDLKLQCRSKHRLEKRVEKQIFFSGWIIKFARSFLFLFSRKSSCASLAGSSRDEQLSIDGGKGESEFTSPSCKVF